MHTSNHDIAQHAQEPPGTALAAYLENTKLPTVPNARLFETSAASAPACMSKIMLSMRPTLPCMARCDITTSIGYAMLSSVGAAHRSWRTSSAGSSGRVTSDAILGSLACMLHTNHIPRIVCLRAGLTHLRAEAAAGGGRLAACCLTPTSVASEQAEQRVGGAAGSLAAGFARSGLEKCSLKARRCGVR